MSYARNTLLSPRDAKLVDFAFNLLKSDAAQALHYFEQVENPNARVYLAMMKCQLKLKNYLKAFNLETLINERDLSGSELQYFRSRLEVCYSLFAIQAKKKATEAFALHDLSTAIQALDEAEQYLARSPGRKLYQKNDHGVISFELNQIRTKCCQRLSEAAAFFFKHDKTMEAITYFKQAQAQARVLKNPGLLAAVQPWVMAYYNKEIRRQLKKGQQMSGYNPEVALAGFRNVLALQLEAAELLGEYRHPPFIFLARVAEKGIHNLSDKEQNQAAEKSKTVIEEKAQDSTEHIFNSFSSHTPSSKLPSSEPSRDVIIDIHDEEEEEKIALPWKKPSVSLTASQLFTLPPLLVNLRNDNYNPNVKEHFAPLISPYRR